MKRIRFGVNSAVYLIFFGAEALEALRTANWPRAIFWLAFGAVSLLADQRWPNPKRPDNA
jgi:hypothetical protein